MPPAPTKVEFKKPVEVFSFADGWKIIEVTDGEDLTTLGDATKCCINNTWGSRLVTADQPSEEELREKLRQEFRAQWDTPAYREHRGDEWVEQQVRGAETCPIKKPNTKVMALVDDKSFVQAAVTLGEKKSVQDRSAPYYSCRDIGQETCLARDGHEFYLLQATYGSAWMSPEVGERCAEWWRTEVEGEWDETAFRAKVAAYNPRGLDTYRPSIRHQ